MPEMMSRMAMAAVQHLLSMIDESMAEPEPGSGALFGFRVMSSTGVPMFIVRERDLRASMAETMAIEVPDKIPEDWFDDEE